MNKQYIKCEDCKKRKAVLTFSDVPIFAISHSWGKKEICRQCLIKRLVEHIKQCERILEGERGLLNLEEYSKNKNGCKE